MLFRSTASGAKVIGFDNFFASSIRTVEDILNHELFCFYEYDLNNPEQMELLRQKVSAEKEQFEKLVYINCAAVVHTEHFYHVNRTFETNVLGMKAFLEHPHLFCGLLRPQKQSAPYCLSWRLPSA